MDGSKRKPKGNRKVAEILAKLDSLNIKRTLSADSYELIAASGFRGENGVLAAIICQELLGQHPITLRGLFYRVVSTGYLPSTDSQHYSRVGRIVKHMRRCGIIDYEWIVDSIRSTVKPSSWAGLVDFADTVREAYRKDFWTRQPNYVHVLCEKDAIAGVIEPVTREYDVSLSPIRGYVSESFVYEIATQWQKINKPIFAAYLGDYDPSGFDIERDLREKLETLSGRKFSWVRLGVNRGDFDKYNLVKLEPKESDRRCVKFIEKHGSDCAEIDAIPSTMIREMVRQFIETHVDQAEWARLQEVETLERETLATIASQIGGAE